MDDNRLLVLEDDYRTANRICHVASEAGFTTRMASSLTAITESCINWCPDVIALDILMPDIDGIEVLQLLREQSNEVHIILLGGSDPYRAESQKASVMGLTVDANISKPFQVAEGCAILKRIKKSLKEKQKLFERDHGNHH